MKVAVYTRVSTGNEGQLTSMVNQKEYYEKYCKEKGYELVNIYADEGLSATSPKRKAYLEMLYDAGITINRDDETGEISFKISNRESKFEMIITKDVSRFARNIDAMGVAKKLEEKKVYILFENANFSTKEPDWQLRLSLLLTFSQQESLDRSKKVSFAYKHRAQKGKFHMSRPLYGYESCPETKEYIINEKEADLVREIFKMYVDENKGTKIISRELNEKGLKTRNDKNWRADGIKRMISNEKYKGQVVVNKYTTTGVTGSNRKITRDDGEWFVYDDAIPVIINAEIWDKAQEIMKQRTYTSKYGNKVGSRAVKSIFHHKIKCKKCDSYFVRVASQKKRKNSDEKITEYIYFCRNRRMFGTCDMKGISHNVLEREITKFGKDILPESLVIKVETELEMKDEIVNTIDKKILGIDKVRKEIQAQVDKVSNDMQVLFTSFLSGEVSDSMKKAVNNQIETLQTYKEKLENQLKTTTTFELEKNKEKIEKLFLETKIISKKTKFSFEEVVNYIDFMTVIENEDQTRTLDLHLNIPSLIVFWLEVGMSDFGSIEEKKSIHQYQLKVTL